MMHRYHINVETLISINFMLIIFTAHHAYANSAIPGPLLIVEWASSADPLRWIAVTMLMCIGIEGAIYHYKNLFIHPYIACTVANVVSLLMGVPLAIFGAFDPTLVIGPTILSIWIEILVLRRFKPKPESEGGPRDFKKSISRPAVIANVLTNLVLLAFLFKT
jgi:hypothetical protein